MAIDYFSAIPITGAVESYAEERLTLDPSETVKTGPATYPVGIKYRFPMSRSQYSRTGGGVQTFVATPYEDGGQLNNVLVTLVDPTGRPFVRQAPLSLWANQVADIGLRRHKTVIFAKGTLCDFTACYFELVEPVGSRAKFVLTFKYW